VTLAVITITGFTATAGAIGAGGLGSLAIRYGYMRYQNDVMAATIAILVCLVAGVQWGGGPNCPFYQCEALQNGITIKIEEVLL